MKLSKRILILALCLCAALSGLCFSASADTSSPIQLKRLGGSGSAYIYHSFSETTTFTAGNTYAFLDGIYNADDAVSALGAGAILQALVSQPDHGGSFDTDYYVKRKYGDTATVKTYVKVITPGADFDTCPFGGLYQVPNTSNPTAYRYFCWKGGAYNCGPYYAYTYQKESITYEKVSASLKSIEDQGSTDSSDYIVSITYNGNQNKTLDPGSYTVKFAAPNTVTFVISDSEGNSVTANFESPLAIYYDGNAEGVSNVPDTQAAWSGETAALSTQTPTRSGYTFQRWQVSSTSTAYSSGASVTPATSLNLLAQWKDSTPPSVTYSPTQVMTGDSDDVVKKAVQAALTITDNEPVSECSTTITLPANCTKTSGNKDVTVKVTDKAGNTTTKTCSVYVNSYVSFGTPSFTESSNKLTATLNNPGTDTVTASGFVWGVMNSPTLTVNNGSAKTSGVVNSAGGTISVTASNLQKGVTYYARAYVTAGGITYYSDEITIGLDLPKYGTFTIKNTSNNTFTVTRTGGSEGKQTVYYRTVNGSAVGGTHFTHKYGTLTFNAGVTTQTITITENGANTAYSGKPATAYSNDNRTYSVEIYRVTGGGSLGSTTSATRTMTNDNNYKVSRSEYTTENLRTVSLSDSNKWVGDHSGKGDWKIYFQNDRGKNTNEYNFNVKRSIDNAYLKATATGFLYRAKFKYKEDDDGYQLAWLGSQVPSTYGPVTIDSQTAIPISSNFGTAKFTATWETNNNKDATLCFPSMSGSEIKKVTATAINGEKVDWNGNACISFAAAETAHLWFSAAGANKDIWYMTEFTDYLMVQDTQEPQLVAVAPMAGGTYRIGDKFVVSLIFDEIVDSANSTLSNVSVNTTWGTAKYTGGADTNVLYFTGTIAQNASSPLKVNSISGTEYIKDMCKTTTTKATATGSGTTTAALDTTSPSFTVTANGITNGTGKATIKVTGTQSATTGMSYAWSDSDAVPTSGWVTLSPSELTTARASSGLTLSIRKEPGSGSSNGKWYLHVKGEYSTTGYTVYNTATLDFGTASSPAEGSTQPTLTVTVDNSNWAKSRTICYSYTQSTGVTLQYRKSDATSWTKPTSSKQASFTKNGYYTFLLTAGDETITKTVEVSKIDQEAPTASVGEPTSASVESKKEGVYTKLVLPVTYSDTGSGVKTVEYAWTDSTETPSSWTTTNAATLTYTPTEITPTIKYLHMKVTDNVGNTYTTCSLACTVISESAVAGHTPTITLEGAPTAWTNDTATLTWTLANYSGKNYEVVLPDGKTSRESSGEIWARQNETYAVTVRDLDYGGENTATVAVDKLDFAAPIVTLSGIGEGWSKSSSQTLTITASDTQSGVGKKYYKIVDDKADIPTGGLTELTEDTITVSGEGEYYIYYKVCDNSGDDSDDVEREANYTEGFQLVQIDRTAPTITFGDYSEDTGITVTVSDSTSKLESVSYKIGSGSETTVDSVEGKAEVSFNIASISAGDNNITVKAVDNAGNNYEYSNEIHKHNYGDLIEQVDATCMNTGMKAHYKCSGCDAYFDTEKNATTIGSLTIAIDENAHSWSEPQYTWNDYTTCTATMTCEHNYEHKITDSATITSEVTTKPTCTVTGIRTYTANFTDARFSHQSKEESIAATGHTEVIDAAVGATCANTGLTEGKHCSVCNGVIVEQTVIEKTAHTPAEAVREKEVDPTCMKAGSYDEVVYCSVCHEEIERTSKTIAALEHIWADEFTIDKEATCTENGSKSKHCTRDGCDVKTAVNDISALDHDYSVSLNNAVAATCTTNGNETDMQCSRCGAVETGATINALGHIMSLHEAVAATCKTTGNVEYWSCLRCNKNFGDNAGTTELTKIEIETEINAGNHTGTLSGWKSDASKHWKEYSCCHAKTEGNSHDFRDWSGGKQVCSDCEYENTCAHHWNEGEVTKEATCTEKGTKKFTCDTCGETKTEDILAKGHAYGAPTYTWDDRKCTAERVCGNDSSHKEAETVEASVATTQTATCTQVELSTYTATFTNTAFVTQKQTGVETAEKLNHNWGTDWLSDAGGHWQKCRNCDATCVKLAHTFGAWSGSQKTCYTCNYVETCTAHDWDNETITTKPTCTEAGVKTFTCKLCGGTKTEPITALGHSEISHEAKNATCTEIGWNEYVTCSRCEYTTYVEIGALGHHGGTATCLARAVCSTCHQEYGELGAHTWQSANCTTPKTCSLCHITDAEELGHNWSEDFAIDTEPTCTTKGSKSRHCLRCDAVTNETEIDALGHDWGRYTVTTEATTETEGWETRTCQRSGCTAEQTRKIDKLPVKTYNINGTVVDGNNDVMSGVNVALVLGDRQIKATTTDTNGAYGFSNIEPGVYNLVATKYDVTKTVKVEITSSNVTVEEIKMPEGKTSSIVEVKNSDGQESIEAVVGNLDTIFTDEKAKEVYTEYDKTAATTGGGSVEIKLTVTKQDEESTDQQITQKLIADDSRNNVGMRLELAVKKTVTPNGGDAEVTPITDTGVLLETVIKLPIKLQGKRSYTVYRLHRGEVQALTMAENADGEYIEISSDKKTLTIHAKYYSEYVIAYQEKSSSSGGSGHTAAYEVITPVQPDEGEILVSPTTAKSGETVTITLKPEEGYEADSVTVLDKDGKAVEISGKGDGTYTFKMPSGQVTISATFKKVEDKGTGYVDCPKDETCPIDKFVDAQNAAWYHDGVHYCLENALMKGLSSTEFMPNGNVTRAQVVTILWRTESSPVVNYAMNFADVSVDQWYAEAIRWAASEGVVTGYSDTQFGPNDSITREQMAAIMYRYAKYKGMDVTGDVADIAKFSDSASVSEYALYAIKWAVGSHIINGTTETALSPQGTATRAQAACIMQRFLTEDK